MAERSKALRSGRSPLLWAWVRIPLLIILINLTELHLLVISYGLHLILELKISENYIPDFYLAFVNVSIETWLYILLALEVELIV
ncbi:hypothetical protein T11_5711 [Trichinella zimbabwensis]|uniref:Uncharacterized protein n=1 Tax=Trichinella zimbabwensis TaxID=268475 RepID=A0A0V1I6F0_9BILA|nr:hypothetical protein T11_5711 [Trichinella zimbabwensis]